MKQHFSPNILSKFRFVLCAKVFLQKINFFQFLHSLVFSSNASLLTLIPAESQVYEEIGHLGGQTLSHLHTCQGQRTVTLPTRVEPHTLALTQDPGPRTQDPGPRTQDPGPRTQDPGPRTQDPGPRTRVRLHWQHSSMELSISTYECVCNLHMFGMKHLDLRPNWEAFAALIKGINRNASF